MSDEPVGLEKSAAEARRKYWQDVYEAASRDGDENAAAQALRYVRQYEAFLALLENEGGSS
jgi:hypothetical protein